MCLLAKNPLWQKEHSAVKEMDNCSGHCFSAHYKSKPRGSPVWPFHAVHGCVYSALCRFCVASIPLHTIPVITQHSPGSTRAAAEELSPQLDEIINHPFAALALPGSPCEDWLTMLWTLVSCCFTTQTNLCMLLLWYYILSQKLAHREGLMLQRKEDQLEGKTNVDWALISQHILSASNRTSLGRENTYQWSPPHAFPTWHEEWDQAAPENHFPYSQGLLEDGAFCPGHNILASLANHHSSGCSLASLRNVHTWKCDPCWARNRSRNADILFQVPVLLSWDRFTCALSLMVIMFTVEPLWAEPAASCWCKS